MKEIKFCVFLFLTFFIHSHMQGQDTLDNYSPVPLYKVFYKMDNHFIGSFTYNYGLNHILAATSTYGIIKSNIVWKWSRLAKNNKSIVYAGLPSVAVSGIFFL
jgi:hypothetical protein